MIQINRLETDVVDICNLRCKHCAHFAHIYNKNTYSFEELERDLNKLSAVLHADKFYMVGGEPFILGKELEKYITMIRNSKISNEVGIVTNGILIHKYENIIPLLDDVYVSLYKSSHYEQIKKWLDDKKELYPQLRVDEINYFYKIFDTTLTKEQSDFSWKNCGAKKECNFVYKGYYYKCAQSIKIWDFFKYLKIVDYPIEKDSGVNIHQENLEEELIRFINTDTKLNTCNICGIGYVWARKNPFPWRELKYGELW